MILASTFLQAANRSQASVYGTNTPAYAGGLIIVAVFAAGGLVLLALAIIRAGEPKQVRVVADDSQSDLGPALALLGTAAALWVLVRGARGQARVLGIIGAAFTALGVLARDAIQWIAEGLLGELDSDVLVSFLAADIVAAGVLTGAGLLLVTRAMVVASRSAWLDKYRQNR